MRIQLIGLNFISSREVKKLRRFIISFIVANYIKLYKLYNLKGNKQLQH